MRTECVDVDQRIELHRGLLVGCGEGVGGQLAQARLLVRLSCCERICARYGFNNIAIVYRRMACIVSVACVMCVRVFLCLEFAKA